MKTVYIHIGNFKTGTSAVQSYCSRHVSRLRANGIDYVKAARTKNAPDSHAALALSLLDEQGCYTPAWYFRNYRSQDLLNAIVSEIDASPCDSALLSSEEFYRIAGQSERNSAEIMQNLSSAFSKYSVRVIMYVKPPLEFYKSWYNQANKGTTAVRRFTDFAFYLNNSLLLPHRNAALWRKNFGTDSLVIEPYVAVGSRHIERFLELLGLNPDSSWAIPDKIVNPKRREDTMELDRVARALALEDPSARIKFLTSEVASDSAKSKIFAEKLEAINREFEKFCNEEHLPIDYRPVTLEDLYRHEKLVNSSTDINPGKFRVLKAKFQNSQWANAVKRIAHSLQ